MPKRISSRPMDVNQAAFLQVLRSTTEPEAEPKRRRSSKNPPTATKTEISRVMAAMGRKGGKVGGKRRLETMTPEQRKAIAQQAARTRWAKVKNSV